MLDYQQARINMLDGQILTAGVIDPGVVSAFETVPRERFVPEAYSAVAYNDEDTSVSDGRFILEPVVHAKLLQALNIQPDHVVLDIGCGTGYSSAILSSLVTTVVALEQDQRLLEHASKTWAEMDFCNIASFVGDLNKGQPDNAPYDLIIFNGAVAEVPEEILSQLAPGGQMVAIIKKADEVMGEVTLIENLGENQFSSYNLFSAGCGYLPGFEPASAFRF